METKRFEIVAAGKQVCLCPCSRRRR
jgi:hypothetical protein